MTIKERFPYQLRLEEPKGDRYFFPEGTMTWPQTTGRGILQSGVYALRLKRVKIKGLTGFQLLEPATLYFNGRFWTLSEGTPFGAYVKNGRKIKI